MLSEDDKLFLMLAAAFGMGPPLIMIIIFTIREFFSYGGGSEPNEFTTL